MNSVQQFNSLNGKKVSRIHLEKLYQKAILENEEEIMSRLNKLFIKYPETKHFELTIKTMVKSKTTKSLSGSKQKMEVLSLTKKINTLKIKRNRLKKDSIKRNKLQQDINNLENQIIKDKTGRSIGIRKVNAVKKALSGTFDESVFEMLSGLYLESQIEDETLGLGKPVSPEQIYNMVTNMVIDAIKNNKNLFWRKTWQSTQYGISATNYISKNPYRGINDLLLNGIAPLIRKKPLVSPYWLTIKQIQKLKGKLKKGSRGHEVIYYSFVYTLKQEEPKIEFSSTDVKKFNAFVKANKNKINSTAKTTKIPILKYYKVFSADDVEGVKFKMPIIRKPKEHERIEAAEAIVKSMPNKPKFILEDKGDKAFYRPIMDSVTMPKLSFFDGAQEYYSTFFHELIHSTGHAKRLNRDMSGRFGTKNYAFEELVAELGSVFLSAESGTLYHTINNSAAYLKGWKSRLLDKLEEDNRFIFKASSKARSAADFILDRDKKGLPKYLKAKTKSSKVKNRPTTEDLRKKISKHELTAKNKNEFEKELQKLGFTIFDVKSNWKSNNDFSRNYKLNYKDIGGVVLSIAVKKVKNYFESEVSYSLKGLLDFEETYGYYENITAIYEDILFALQSDFSFSVTKASNLRDKFHNTLFSKSNKSQIALFGSINIPFFKTRKEAKKYFLNWALKHLKGKKYFHNEIGKMVVFNRKGIEHTISNKLTIPKASLIMDAEGMLKRSVLLQFKHDNRNRSNIKGVYKMKTSSILNNKIVEVILTLREGDNGVIYYDHNIVEIKKLPSTSKGQTTIAKHSKKVSCSKEQTKVTKKEIKSKKSLGTVVIHTGPTPTVATALEGYAVANELENKESNITAKVKEIEVINEEEVKPEKETTPTILEQKDSTPIRDKHFKKFKGIGLMSASERRKNSIVHEYFNFTGDNAQFLGKLEKKKKESVAINLSGTKGSMKTRYAFITVDMFLSHGLTVGFASLEEHHESALFEAKEDQYIAQSNLSNFFPFSDLPPTYREFLEIINSFDAFFIDSWQKAIEKYGNINFDSQYRKAVNGKILFTIFQETISGNARGGSKSGHDGDIILKIEKFDDYTKNYVYAEKNRYELLPGAKYNIHSQKLITTEEVEEETLSFPSQVII